MHRKPTKFQKVLQFLGLQGTESIENEEDSELSNFDVQEMG